MDKVGDFRISIVNECKYELARYTDQKWEPDYGAITEYDPLSGAYLAQKMRKTIGWERIGLFTTYELALEAISMPRYFYKDSYGCARRIDKSQEDASHETPKESPKASASPAQGGNPD